MMQTWDGDTPNNFSSCYAGRSSHGLARVRCFLIRRGFCALNRTPKDCVIEFGGDLLPTRQLHGPRSSE